MTKSLILLACLALLLSVERIYRRVCNHDFERLCERHGSKRT